MNGGNVSGFRVVVASFDPPSVPANSVADWSIPVPGMTAGMFGIARPPALTTGLSIQNVLTTTDAIIVRVDNQTAAPIDQGAAAWNFLMFPPAGEDVSV